MNKSTMLAAFCAASVLLAGCGATTSEMESRAQQEFASGNLDAAKRDIESAQRKAAKENAGSDAQARLSQQLAQVNAAIETRRIAREDDERAAGAAALRAAKSNADAKNWKQMSRELSNAQGHAKKANDAALNGAIDEMVRSQPVKLVGASAAYRSMCSKAGWSTAIEFFDGDPFWLDLNTMLDTRLERSVESVGDSELREAGYAVAKEWREYIRAKEIEKNTRNDNSTIGILINAGAAGARVKNRIEYMQAQTRFEKRLNELLAATSMPAPSYAPTRRDAPPAPAAAPVAAAPAAPAAPTAPVAEGTGAHPAAQVASNPASRTQGPAPAAPAADRTAPNFDDLRQ